MTRRTKGERGAFGAAWFGSLAIALATGCAGSTPPEPAAPAVEAPHEEAPHAPHVHGPSFDDPARFVPAWNAPDRDTWQKPEEILRALALSRGEVVVDLGAGTGYLIARLTEAVGPEGVVLASDTSPAMLDFLREAAEAEGWENLRTHAHPADDPALEPESVDAVVALNVWHHVEARPAFAEKIARALRPGGAFVVVDFLAEETPGFGPPLAMRLRAEEVRADLDAAGLATQILEETMPRHYVVRGVKLEDARASETGAGGVQHLARIEGCELSLTVEGARLWLKAAPVDEDARCALTDARFRRVFAHFADAVRARLREGSPLGVVLDVHTDPEAVERWFRHQAADERIQTLLGKRVNADTARALASHLRESGALDGYEALFAAMGLALEDLSLEKIEVRRVSEFERDRPEVKAWSLPPKARVALPFLTWAAVRDVTR